MEVFIEEIADDLDEHIRLFIKRDRFSALRGFFLLGLGGNILPPVMQALHIGSDGLFGNVFGSGADDGAAFAWHHAAQDIL